MEGRRLALRSSLCPQIFGWFWFETLIKDNVIGGYVAYVE